MRMPCPNYDETMKGGNPAYKITSYEDKKQWCEEEMQLWGHFTTHHCPCMSI